MENYQDVPLLPTSEAPCKKLDCQEQQKLIKKRSFRMVMYSMLALLTLFFIYKNGRHQGWSGCEPGLDADFKEPQMGAMNIETHESCREKPTIPYDDISSFSFQPESYQNLKIEYKSNKEHQKHLNVYGGSTIVLKDDSLTNVTVELDVKFTDRVSHDDFSIEKTSKNDTYAIYLKDNSDFDHTCITIDIVIKVPNASALEGLIMTLINNNYNLDEGLAFKKLHLDTVNGNYDFQKGISSGNTTFNGVNSVVKGKINSLTGNLNVKTIDGKVELLVEEIIQREDGTLVEIKSVNGRTNIQLVNIKEWLFSFVFNINTINTAS
ncbi:unnamed protein product [Rhizopus stolonifer]